MVLMSSVPQTGFLGPIKVADNVWIIRKLFHLGADQKSGLTWEGLRDRFLSLLGKTPMSHPALMLHNEQESTEVQIEEERVMVSKLINGDTVPFPLDSTMTIIRGEEDKLTLHSVVEVEPQLISAVNQLGTVDLILIPNLQHWLFLEGWAREFPNAAIGLGPSAFDEDLRSKMEFLTYHRGQVFDLTDGESFGEGANEIYSNSSSNLEARLLRGAPLNLNEYVFFHKLSGTLITADSFYGGYVDDEIPTWFARIWFKLTKDGSFRLPRLPIYRTSRVLSHGNSDELFDSVEDMVRDWDIKIIIFAHGTSPFDQGRIMSNSENGGELNDNAVGELFVNCWRDGLAALEHKS
ncbi:unnamed protein product [Meganyctiphanes norvegica]|uniref:DUF4336 domain-containing protein n=1 Tax=Meganyctiphanes norvegica TaxID=48144 RepID=A0AAV2PIU0_MEGNR